MNDRLGFDELDRRLAGLRNDDVRLWRNDVPSTFIGKDLTHEM